MWKCKWCITSEIANWRDFTRSFNVFHRLSKSVMWINRFGWLCHFERVVRCLKPGNNALHSVCVVMLCYGFVLLCLSSLLKSGCRSSCSEKCSLSSLFLYLSIYLSDRSAEYSFTNKTRPQYDFTFVTQPIACTLFQCASIYHRIPQAFTAPNLF